MSTKKLSLSKETLANLSQSDLEQVQGAAGVNTKNNYTCNGSVGIACTVLNCATKKNSQACGDTSIRYTGCGSVGIICTH